MTTPQNANVTKSQQHLARRIAVSLLKGGVAKTGTSVHLAHGLALAGKKVLLVDTDVQSQCGEMLGCKPINGLAQVMCGLVKPFEALIQARDNLWLLSGGNDLAGVKMEIARRELAPEAVMSEALEPFYSEFDYIIFDTAPGWDSLLVNALYCVNEVMAPVSMEPMALSGLKNFEDRLSIIQRYNNNLLLRWVVPTFVDRRVKKSAVILRKLIQHYGPKITPPVMYSARLSETTATGKTIFETDPNGTGTTDYQRLTKRVLTELPPLVTPEEETFSGSDGNTGHTPLRSLSGSKRHGLRKRLKQRQEEAEDDFGGPKLTAMHRG